MLFSIMSGGGIFRHLIIQSKSLKLLAPTRQLA